MSDLEEWLLQDRPARYVQLATAASLEGEETLRKWHDLGAQAADRLGAEQVVIDVRVREDAFDPSHVEAIAGAGLIYLSGGNPTFLADTLRDTPVWAAIVDAWRGGAGLAGCSAGAMAMGGYVPNYRHPRSGGTHGLQIVPNVRVLPHFDRYTRWMPDFALRPLVTDDAVVLGIDEDTALVAQSPDDPATPWEFTPRGRQHACEVTRGGTMRIDRIELHVDVPR